MLNRLREEGRFVLIKSRGLIKNTDIQSSSDLCTYLELDNLKINLKAAKIVSIFRLCKI